MYLVPFEVPFEAVNVRVCPKYAEFQSAWVQITSPKFHLSLQIVSKLPFHLSRSSLSLSPPLHVQC